MRFSFTAGGAASYDRRMITHLKFAGIPTRDQDRALAFYTEKLGFKVLTDQPMGPTQRWIELRIAASDTRVVLFTPDGPLRVYRSTVFWTPSGLKLGCLSPGTTLLMSHLGRGLCIHAVQSARSHGIDAETRAAPGGGLPQCQRS